MDDEEEAEDGIGDSILRVTGDAFALEKVDFRYAKVSPLCGRNHPPPVHSTEAGYSRSKSTFYQSINT